MACMCGAVDCPSCGGPAAEEQTDLCRGCGQPTEVASDRLDRDGGAWCVACWNLDEGTD